MFVFVLQGFWLYIAELAGKELDAWVTAKFMMFYTPKLIPLVVPLTILLSSIMVFGNFAENYEFAAMKSTGISLQRAMRSLAVFISILGLACFFFANNVIPWGEYEFFNLRQNIRKQKPALAIVEGQFNQVGDITIKVNKKYGDNGKLLKAVVIHQKSKHRQGNFKVIVAEKGELKSSTDSNILQLELQNGYYYEDIQNTDTYKKKPHVKSFFETYTTNIDLGLLDAEDFEEKKYSDRFNMLDISDLKYTIDSLKQKEKTDYENFTKNTYNRTNYSDLNKNLNLKKETHKDSLYLGNVMDLFKTNEKKYQIITSAYNASNSAMQVINSNKKSLANKKVNLNKHIHSLHEKYVLAFACVILFFVGAPLGALIRKGGFGLPIVIAMILFLTYHFFGIFSKKIAEKGTISPVLGAWLSTGVMLPLSIYLTNRATNDKGVFNFDFITVPIKKLFSNQKLQLSESDTKSYNYYKRYDISKLIEIIKQQDEFALDKKPKEIALHNLLNRNINLEELRTKGLDIPDFVINAKSLFHNYSKYSKYGLRSYAVGILTLILFLICNNNKLPVLAWWFSSISILSAILFMLFLILSLVSYSSFYKTIYLREKRIHPLLLPIVMALYPLSYIILKSRTEEDFYYTNFKNIN